jgi:enoyl-CoA hydratase
VLALFNDIKNNANVKVVLISGSSSTFSTGMDLTVFAELQQVANKQTCEGRKREGVAAFVQFLQDACSAPERCAVPVLACIAGNCIGAGVDFIAACDMRYCTDDAVFCIKETDLAIVRVFGCISSLYI